MIVSRVFTKICFVSRIMKEARAKLCQAQIGLKQSKAKQIKKNYKMQSKTKQSINYMGSQLTAIIAKGTCQQIPRSYTYWQRDKNTCAPLFHQITVGWQE